MFLQNHRWVKTGRLFRFHFLFLSRHNAVPMLWLGYDTKTSKTLWFGLKYLFLAPLKSPEMVRLPVKNLWICSAIKQLEKICLPVKNNQFWSARRTPGDLPTSPQRSWFWPCWFVIKSAAAHITWTREATSGTNSNHGRIFGSQKTLTDNIISCTSKL